MNKMEKSNILTSDINEVEKSKKQRDSFVFYRSFQEAINELPESEQLVIYRLIASYALDREEPVLDGTTKIVWLLVKPQLDANWRKHNKGCKGGAPKGNSNAVKTTKNNLNQLENNLNQPENNLKQPNVNDNVNVNDNNNDNILEEFIIPFLSDVKRYVADNKLSVNAEEFYDYYAANGWMMGRNPMADWKAALRSWNRKPGQEISIQLNTPSYDL